MNILYPDANLTSNVVVPVFFIMKVKCKGQVQKKIVQNLWNSKEFFNSIGGCFI